MNQAGVHYNALLDPKAKTIAMTTAPASPTTGRTVYLETFGCQMNTLDSQLVRGQLQALGYQFVDNWRQAEVILYNTCSVRDRAEQKVYSRLGDVGVHKRRQPGVVLGVIGCMAQQHGRELAQRFGQIDLMCAPSELDKLPGLIETALAAGPAPGVMPVSQAALQAGAGGGERDSGEHALELLDLARAVSTEEHHGSAYVRITRGCNKFCSYCVVPRTRGAEVHRPPDSIVDECRRLVDAGVVEITLLGQTVNHYHFDHGAMVVANGIEQPQTGSPVGPGGPRVLRRAGGSRRVTTFAELLGRIHEEVPGLARLRFVTNLPRDFGDDILAVMAECRRICRYLHLPVQSGSDRILKLMNRGYTAEMYFDLLDRARTVLPDVQIASDLICGFPTETEADHALTVDLLRRGGFKNCFVFKYSQRAGTVAAEKFADDVPEEVKRRRNVELLAVQAEISTELHSGFVGRSVSVFVESISAKAVKSSGAVERVTQLTGRTEGDLIVLFDGDPALVGSIIDVQIDSAARLALFGRVANGAGQR